MVKKNILGGNESRFGGQEEDDSAPNMLDFAPHLLAENGFKPSGKLQEMSRLKEELDALKAQLADAQTKGVAPENAIIPMADGTRLLGRFTLTRNALVMPDGVTEDELRFVTEFVRDVHGAVQFWAGDLANIYLGIYGGKAEAIEWLSRELGIELNTLQDWALVCKKMDQPLRKGNLLFSHHREVVYMPQDVKGRESEILQYASEYALSVRDLKVYIKSLLPVKLLPKRVVESLFSKERAPKITEMKKTFMLARKGDSQARQALRTEIDDYRKWLLEIARSAGLE